MPSTVNVGLGFDYSIRDYYEAIAKTVGFEGEFIFDLSRPVGMKQKLVDVNLMSDFGWHHKVSLDEGLSLTFNYFKESSSV